MRYLNSTHLQDNGKLTVGGGVTQGVANEVVFAHPKSRFFFPGGTARSVGVGGISTVGGINRISRTYGMTIDTITSFTITIPPKKEGDKSKTINVSKKFNRDLFWALLGGGGNNFGAISEIQYQLFPVADMFEYEVDFGKEFSFQMAEMILSHWRDTSPSRSVEYSEEMFLRISNRVAAMSLSGLYAPLHGQSTEVSIKNIQQTLSSLISIGGTLVISKNPTKFENIYRRLVANRVFYRFASFQGVFIDTFDPRVVLNGVNNSLALDDGVVILEIQLQGGVSAISKKGAFGFRKANFFHVPVAMWNSQGSSLGYDNMMKQYMKEIKPVVKGGYLGFPISYDIAHTNEIYFGRKNYLKLLEIKHKYDPQHVLSSSGTL